MKIVIAADHGGFGLKSVLLSHLRESGNDVSALGGFLAVCFSGLERHVRRVGKVLSIEREFMKTVSGPKR
jgi:ribose 5-phosphate isomerase RpiB